MYWTRSVTEAITKGGTYGLQQLEAQNTKELMEEVRAAFCVRVLVMPPSCALVLVHLGGPAGMWVVEHACWARVLPPSPTRIGWCDSCSEK
jgi:hypothetical protein